MNLVTSTEIAEMAGVWKSTVSNWKKRYNDFPKEADVGNQKVKLYHRVEVERWLIQRGKISG